MNIRLSYDEDSLISAEVKKYKQAQRPKSVSRQSANTSSQRPKSRVESRRSISDFIPEPNKEIFENRNILGLDFGEIKQIYTAKCQDLGIPSFPDQEKRFFNYCWLHFKDRKFVMSESGLGSKCAKVIGEILRNNPNYAFLDLSKNSIKDAGAVDLLNNIRKSYHIVHLDISSNDITPEGSKIILDMLEKNQSIISLDISSHEGLHRNRLCAEGGESLSKILSGNKILTYLNISGTSLGPEGLNYLLKGLDNNLSLTSLNLSNNNLGNKIIEKFSQIIVTTDIHELFIANNKIGNDGCEYLGLMLSGGYEGYCTLLKLDISDNDISTKGLSLLFDAIRINNQLTTLIIKKNNFLKGLS